MKTENERKTNIPAPIDPRYVAPMVGPRFGRVAGIFNNNTGRSYGLGSSITWKDACRQWADNADEACLKEAIPLLGMMAIAGSEFFLSMEGCRITGRVHIETWELKMSRWLGLTLLLPALLHNILSAAHSWQSPHIRPKAHWFSTTPRRHMCTTVSRANANWRRVGVLCNEISGCALPLKHNYTTDQRRFHVDKDIMITCFPFFRDIIVVCSVYCIFNFLEGALTPMHNKMKISSAKSLA